MAHHLLFEGAELAGKSWLMSQLYSRLEPKYHNSPFVLDGCHWLNADIGVFGTQAGPALAEAYVRILEILPASNLLVEKLHISDAAYQELYQGRKSDYTGLEARLKALDFKIVLVLFPEDEELLAGRLADRLRLYPHYDRIKHAPAWYIEQQRLYRRLCSVSELPVLELTAAVLPDQSLVNKLLTWIGEEQE